ncbi:proliferating cell nuclear antigen (pcna) [Candidatus Woesearchaeota archaeon]|nr:MAG: proliferating cell nuclear antigen (pcna) [Candidatus Woesearchaeota archaeon]
MIYLLEIHKIFKEIASSQLLGRNTKMRLVLAEPGYLKDSISILSELVNEARFKITKNGLKCIAMDPANVAMVIFELLASNFVEYQIDEDKEIGINLANFKQVLKRATAADVLTLEVTDDNKLKIQLKASTTRTFSLPLLEIEENEQKVPNLEFPVSIKLKAHVLNDAINDADIVAESVTFNAEPETFSIRAEGDLSKAHIEIKSDDRTQISSQLTANVKAKYSIEYLKKMMQGSKISEDVEVRFNQDYPLKLDYKVQDKLLLSFILAPRVEND